MLRTFTLLTLVILLIAPAQAIAGEPDDINAHWLTRFEDASALAQSSDRNMLISFSGSDWCLPCMRLKKELFDTDDFLTYTNDNLVLLKLDFPARKKNMLSEEQLKHNETLAERYNKKGAFPLVVITDPNGNVKGYMEHPLSSSTAYIKSIQSILKDK